MTEQTVDSEVQHPEQVPEEAQVASQEPAPRIVRIRVGRNKRKLRIVRSTIQHRRESPSKKQTVDPEVQQIEQVREEAELNSRQPEPRNRMRRFISRIPYTNEFDTRIDEWQHDLNKYRLDAYKSLKSIDRDLKEKLAPQFEYGTRRLSQAESWLDEISSITFFLALVIFFLLYGAGPPLIAKFLPHLIGWNLHSFWGWVLELFVTALTGVMAIFTVSLPPKAVSAVNRRMQMNREFFDRRELVLSWQAVLLVVALGYLYGLYTGRLAVWPWLFRHALVFSFVIQAGFLLPLFFAVAAPIQSFLKVLESRKQRFLTRAVIIDELLNVLHRIEEPNYERTWNELSRRTLLTKSLEKVASCIENHFPRYFMTGAVDMDLWTDRSASEMANGVRETIKLVVVPTKHTLDDFKARVTKYFAAALASEWGEFDRVPAEKLSRKQSVKDRVTSAVTALLTAAVPVLLLLLLRRLDVVAEPLLTYLTVGSYVWAALSLLSRVDPQYAAKLGALKDITSILPFGKGKAEK